jgi:hypothetical protein
MANPIILNNAGDDQYGFLGREWTSNPIKCSYLKLFLSESAQANEILEIRSKTASGAFDYRKISLSNYIDSKDKDSKIILIPLNPVLVLDGSTYFRLKIPAQSEITMVFYYDKQLNILN